jgi:2-polyprenyl-3-methyl-5-hydroxy-6-metoxy-1,4-benzoquinol methylase
MSTQQWYEKLFSNYANTYEKEVFTQGTLQEVDFLEQELKSNQQAHILDVGCGTGRHAIELAKRGYKVKGIDLSENMLQKAKAKAREQKVNVEFEQADARTFTISEKYDMVIMLCEGGFSLMETDEMNFAILKNAASALKPGGKFVFTCLNALYPLYHSVKDLVDNGGQVKYDKLSFDLETFREHSTAEFTDDSGKVYPLTSNERFYAPSEITWMLKCLGFSEIGVFGGEIGQFARQPITPDYFELLVVAE